MLQPFREGEKVTILSPLGTELDAVFIRADTIGLLVVVTDLTAFIPWSQVTVVIAKGEIK